MKITILALIMSLFLMSSVAFCAPRITLVSGNGTEAGTTSNPLYVQGV
jgi:hypothetical protein